MRWDALALPALLMSVLGSPYLADEPVAGISKSPLDSGLIGTWRCVAPDSTESGVFVITRVTALEASAAVKNDPDRYRLVSAGNSGARLLNVQVLDSDDKSRGWVLARYAVHSPNVLQVDLARAEPFRGMPAGAKASDILRVHLKRGDLFENYCACIRVVDEK